MICGKLFGRRKFYSVFFVKFFFFFKLIKYDVFPINVCDKKFTDFYGRIYGILKYFATKQRKIWIQTGKILDKKQIPRKFLMVFLKFEPLKLGQSKILQVTKFGKKIEFLTATWCKILKNVGKYFWKF